MDRRSDKEKFYDECIAPELMRLNKLCLENGLSFVAEVEWLPGEGGTTVNLQENASGAMRMVRAACSAHGNLDAMVMGLARYIREQNLDHSSIVLNSVGVKPLVKDR